MNLKTFGQSNLTVTPIGLGLAALGRPGYVNLGHAQDLNHNYDVAAMEAHTHTVLDAAWDAGIRYFDAARSYGRSETFLASWLQTRLARGLGVSAVLCPAATAGPAGLVRPPCCARPIGGAEMGQPTTVQP